MNTKLTLTVEDSIIAKAKSYAKSTNRSLSDLISNYLKLLTTDMEEPEIEFSPKVQALKGSFTAPENMDYKKELAKELASKYL